ncbi:microtubule-associated protein Jupiter-like isoform X2 [Rhodnius prolixus]|uniref:Microtubule-associated protein Jupiter n=2 Tax=Rhodnius TaxID=13248 RepID=R4FN15_RHOPR
MATYAAYRHIELDKVGYGKKRVLKPPGGGSSDIFGTTGGSQETNFRRVKNHLASNVFLSDEPTAPSMTNGGGQSIAAAPTTAAAAATPAKQNSGNDSFCRLFGPPSPPKSAVKPKNKLQSNILPTTEPDQRVVTNGNSEHINGDNTDGGHNNVETAMMNGNSQQPIVNGNRTNGTNNPRARVPPGGFSSGLW